MHCNAMSPFMKYLIIVFILSLSSTIDNELGLEQEYNKLLLAKTKINLESLQRQAIPIEYIYNCRGKNIIKKLGLKGDCEDDINKIALLRWWHEQGWTRYKGLKYKIGRNL